MDIPDTEPRRALVDVRPEALLRSTVKDFLARTHRPFGIVWLLGHGAPAGTAARWIYRRSLLGQLHLYDHIGRLGAVLPPGAALVVQPHPTTGQPRGETR